MLFGLTVLGSSCEEPEPPEPIMLVDHELWREVSADDDPFEDRPEEVECNPLGWGDEYIGEHSLEVELANCNYLLVAQESLAPIEVGDELAIRLWHNALVGPEGESHMAITVDGFPVWDLSIPIPSESELIMDISSASFRAEVGAEVLFHIHNHGANTYNLIEVSVTNL